MLLLCCVTAVWLLAVCSNIALGCRSAVLLLGCPAVLFVSTSGCSTHVLSGCFDGLPAILQFVLGTLWKCDLHACRSAFFWPSVVVLLSCFAVLLFWFAVDCCSAVQPFCCCADLPFCCFAVVPICRPADLVFCDCEFLLFCCFAVAFLCCCSVRKFLQFYLECSTVLPGPRSAALQVCVFSRSVF